MATEYKSKTGMHPLWQIGIKVLQRILKKHHETIATVLQTLIDKIIAGGLSISQYTGKISMVLQYINVDALVSSSFDVFLREILWHIFLKIKWYYSLLK